MISMESVKLIDARALWSCLRRGMGGGGCCYKTQTKCLQRNSVFKLQIFCIYVILASLFYVTNYELHVPLFSVATGFAMGRIREKIKFEN